MVFVDGRWPFRHPERKYGFFFVSVRCQDHCLQVVEFCGCFSIELWLTFGGGNCPTLCYMPPSLLISFTENEMELDKDLNLMQLDDSCSVDGKGSVQLRQYRLSYKEMAAEIGVSLASEDNLT